MGTCGRLLWMDDTDGNCSYTVEVHNDMGPDQPLGRMALSMLKTCKTREQFADITLKFLKRAGYIDEDELEVNCISDTPWLRHANLVRTSFYNAKRAEDGIGTYFYNWNSDFLYIVNMTGTDIETFDYNNNSVKIQNGYLNVLDFGKIDHTIPIVDEVSVPEEKENTMKNTESEMPVVTLSDITKKYGIKITKEDFTTVESIENILASGVNEVTLCYDKDRERVTVQGDYKSVTCTNVKVKSISNKGNMNDSISDTKLHIQCSHWMFPCPDYKYSSIKRNLETAICKILGIGECEVESFNTGIVEFDEDKS